jgi:hypothetical protein
VIFGVSRDDIDVGLLQYVQQTTVGEAKICSKKFQKDEQKDRNCLEKGIVPRLKIESLSPKLIQVPGHSGRIHQTCKVNTYPKATVDCFLGAWVARY